MKLAAADETRPALANVPVPAVDAAPHEQDVPWRHRHLLDVDVLSVADLELVMRTADAMREVLDRPIAKVPALRGSNVTILFYEASTRTRVSFEVAAKNLSADVVNIAAATSSVTKGVSLVDTIRTVSTSDSPFDTDELAAAILVTSADRFFAATSNDTRVRVDAS